MIFEEKILAYLDGALDEESRSELMHTLSVSPEKRALLEEHLKLREMTALGQKPYTVPLKLEQSLAGKLPVLAEHLPYLMQPASRMAMTGGALAGIRQFFMAHAVALSVATVAVLGVGAWVATKGNGTNGTERTNTANVTRPEIANTNVANSATGQHSTSVATQEVVGNQVPSSSLSTAQVSSHGPVNSSTQGAIEPVLLHNAARAVNVGNAVATFAPAMQQNVVTTQQNVSGAPSELDQYSASANMAMTSVEPRMSPTRLLPDGAQPATLHELIRPVPSDYSPLYFVATTSGSSASLPSSNGLAVIPSPLQGGLFSLAGYMSTSPWLSFGVEFGRAPIFEMQSTASTSGIDPVTTLNRITYVTSAQANVNVYAKAVAQFTINPMDDWQFSLNPGFGMAIRSSAAYVGSFDLGLDHVLDNHFSFVLQTGVAGASYYSQPTSSGNTASNSSSAVGIVRNDQTARTLLTFTPDFRVGLLFRP